VARQIGIAWVLTIPAAGLVAGLAYLVVHPILG
jgi:PiT family inorganic phosphate transporter